ncbi:MAG: hypothetical protein WC343_09750 [Bacilli bacterium]|jgi:hypothetical protein
MGDWEINGIRGRGEAPKCAGNQRGLAVVMATGRCVWDDVLYHFDPESNHAHVIAVNNMILHWKKRVHHGVSMHPEEPGLWRALRRYYQGEESHVHTHGYRKHNKPELEEVDYVWDIPRAKGGTSTLLAVYIGLALGFNRIVICGAPLDNTGHFYDPAAREDKTFGSDFLKTEWMKSIREDFKGRVRSVSGRTKQWMGAPDSEWLKGV